MNLFEIDYNIQKCLVMDGTVVDGDTGEILDVDYLDNLEMEKNSKIENIAKWIKNLDSDIEALKKQKEIFDERKNIAEKKRDSLKNYLSAFLDGEKWDANDKSVSVSFRKSDTVEVLDIDKIPCEYLVLTEPKVDKTSLKKELRKGTMIDGARLVIKNNIQIK